MNFLDTEEKLINVQININDSIKERETLSKIDNAIDVLDNEVKTLEQLSVTIKDAEMLSSSFKLPLKIKGRMLGIGRHAAKYYTEIELRKAVELYKGKHIPLKIDHRENEVGSTIGRVDEIYWDEINKCIRYKAHINDETHARNVVDGVTDDVSASIYANKAYDVMLGLVGKNLEFSELSLVYNGAYKENDIEVYK